jgi:methanogenic corrinoid protein MtbC1
VSSVTERFFSMPNANVGHFGAGERDAFREDLSFQLDLLRPVLEFGLLAPIVDYLSWLSGVLEARDTPPDRLAMSLEWLAEFFVANMEASDADVVKAALMEARAGLLAVQELPAAPVISAELEPDVSALQEALLVGDHRRALAIVNACIDAGRSLVDIESNVIQTVMYRIGAKWQANEVTVAQEHLATAIVQSVMTVALLKSTPAAPNNKRVLLACVAGNHHTIGLRMVADSFQLAGWDIRYLGANVPTSSLIQQIGEWSPDLVGLSLSFAPQLRTVKEIIARLSERFGPSRPAVIIGGLTLNRFDRMVALVGADAYSVDAKSALDAVGQLV